MVGADQNAVAGLAVAKHLSKLTIPIRFTTLDILLKKGGEKDEKARYQSNREAVGGRAVVQESGGTIWRR